MASVIQTVKNTIAENFGVGDPHSLASKEHQFALADVPDQSSKVAVVTGGSDGIGYGCAHTLLANNISKVFIVSSTQSKVDDKVEKVKQDIGAEAAKRIVWIQCDLGEWDEVPKVAKQIQEQTDRLDILINDAARGIMTYELTSYGVDRHMAVNHMGHTILTSHLLPLLKQTAKANPSSKVRIVNLGSNAHQGAPSHCKFESLDELNTDLGPNGQYGRSKLAVMLHARYLDKHVTSKYPNILANCVHPGIVETRQSKVDIHEPYPLLGYGMSVGMAPFKKDIWQGCCSAVYCATKTEKSGEYICPPAVPEAGSKLYQNYDLAEQVMKLTRDIVGEKTGDKSSAKGCPFSDF